MTDTRMTKQQWQVRAAERVAAAQGILAQQVEALRSGEDWRRYLDFQARLHGYSPRNVMLIAAQHAVAYNEGRVTVPEPRYVAGFHTWKALGRSVDKDQRGYAVLAPIRYKRHAEVDREVEVPPVGGGEDPREAEPVSQGRLMTGVKVAHVFELGQTSGRPMPEPPLPRLIEGEAPAGLGLVVLSLLEGRGYRVATVPSAASISGANGETNWADGTVLIRSDMDDAAMVKTLIHEAGHVLLHEGAPGRYLPRPLKEVEAESVSYVVAAAHGMPTGEYSFPYVVGWAGDAGSKAVLATQDRVGRAARMILDASPALHEPGGRVPGAEAALAASQERRAQLEAEMSSSGVEPVAAL
jgi:hypothetical protein